MKRTITIVYFAWVKERLGVSEEALELSDSISSVADAVAALQNRTASHGQILGDLKKLRFALDHDFVQPDMAIADARELAIFPPVTGG